YSKTPRPIQRQERRRVIRQNLDGRLVHMQPCIPIHQTSWPTPVIPGRGPSRRLPKPIPTVFASAQQIERYCSHAVTRCRGTVRCSIWSSLPHLSTFGQNAPGCPDHAHPEDEAVLNSQFERTQD